MRLALRTGWAPSEVRLLTLRDIDAIGTVDRERKRAQARASRRGR
jgi:hypothetical protein